LRVGDSVWAYQYEDRKGGFYAEYAAVAADHVAAKPRSLEMLQAGAGAVTSLTAQQGIDDHLKLKRDETVLVFGASGAVGTLAVQFAKLRHARVIGIVPGEDAARLVRKLGADEASDSRSRDFAEQLRAFAPEELTRCSLSPGAKLLSNALHWFVPAAGSHTQTAWNPSLSAVPRFVSFLTMHRRVHSSLRGWSARWKKPGCRYRLQRYSRSKKPQRPTNVSRVGTSWAESFCRFVGTGKRAMMTVKLNEPAFQHAQEPVAEGKVVLDQRDDWSEHPPSTQEENEFIRLHGFREYGK
jgi:NADPH:quinone reductase-like Zn-dependent oxidoreductase